MESFFFLAQLYFFLLPQTHMLQAICLGVAIHRSRVEVPGRQKSCLFCPTLSVTILPFLVPRKVLTQISYSTSLQLQRVLLGTNTNRTGLLASHPLHCYLFNIETAIIDHTSWVVIEISNR